MKQRVRDCDEQNLETGRNHDVNWMLCELGLSEILFDPPPKRPRVRLGSGEGDGMWTEDDGDQGCD